MSLGVPELLIVLVIVALVFGTRKLQSLGGDLGKAIKGFRSAVSEDEPSQTAAQSVQESNANQASQSDAGTKGNAETVKGS